MRNQLDKSDDPVKENHYFVIANPVKDLIKVSKNLEKSSFRNYH